jgi:flagellar biosynthesis chaperone FliJ
MKKLLNFALSEKLSNFKEEVVDLLNKKVLDALSQKKQNITEISNSTLHSYIKKASTDSSNQFNKQLSSGTKATQSWNTHKETGLETAKTDFEKHNNDQQNALRKMQNRKTGIGLAHDKIVGSGVAKPKAKVFGTESEEIGGEVISEISKETASEYVQKASGDRSKRVVNQSRNSETVDPKIENRTTGIGLALKTLSKKDTSPKKDKIGVAPAFKNSHKGKQR